MPDPPGAAPHTGPPQYQSARSILLKMMGADVVVEAEDGVVEAAAAANVLGSSPKFKIRTSKLYSLTRTRQDNSPSTVFIYK